MIRKSAICLVCIFAAGIQLRATQDFERSYPLTPGRNITIDNKMGDVTVTGYSGKDIKVSAYKKGPDTDSIKIVDKSFGPQIILFPMSSKFKSSETRVDFEVKVPESSKFVFINLKSGSGNIEVANFSGGLVAESWRGDVKVVNVNGFIDARSISGNMDAEINQAQGISQLRFSSMSGDIKITAPSDFGALVSMKSSSGDLKTDFPIHIRQGRYRDHMANGKLGSGTQMLYISSVSGNVSLMKK